MVNVPWDEHNSNANFPLSRIKDIERLNNELSDMRNGTYWIGYFCLPLILTFLFCTKVNTVIEDEQEAAKHIRCF